LSRNIFWSDVDAQAGIVGARLDGAPAGRLAVEKRDEAAGRLGPGSPQRVCRRSRSARTFWGVVLERLARRELVALTKTPRRLAALTRRRPWRSAQLASLAGRTVRSGWLVMKVAVTARRHGAPTLCPNMSDRRPAAQW
jgi:hypothetical protein